MKLKKGFSLIELLVVILIIGVLAAVAVPVYQNYSVQARVSAVVPIFDNLMQDAMAYAGQHGYFPNAAQLNIGAGSSISNPSQYNEYIKYLYIEDISTKSLPGGASPVPCGRAGIITAHIGPIPGLGAQNVVKVTCMLANKNSTVATRCDYMYTTSNSAGGQYTSLSAAFVTEPASGQIITGWNNQISESALNTDVKAFYTGATCM